MNGRMISLAPTTTSAVFASMAYDDVKRRGDFRIGARGATARGNANRGSDFRNPGRRIELVSEAMFPNRLLSTTLSPALPSRIPAVVGLRRCRACSNLFASWARHSRPMPSANTLRIIAYCRPSPQFFPCPLSSPVYSSLTSLVFQITRRALRGPTQKSV